jgi:hypothetical protein
VDRKTGYLASSLNIPPLIFRFQFNPEILTEKKGYKWEQANGFGQWGFDQAAAGATKPAVALGYYKDAKEIGSLLTATRPLEPVEGELRQFELEFKLDASIPGPMDGEEHFKGSISEDLAVLRSFMNPSYDLPDIISMIVDHRVGCFVKPPLCTLNYAGISSECAMTDLTIKHSAFKDNGDPLRADVRVTLKEQTFSTDPLIDLIKRNVYVALSYRRAGIGTDLAVNTPILGGIFEHFL